MNFLWLVWLAISLGGFAVLEYVALRTNAPLDPLTYWIRLAFLHFGWLMSIVVGGFVAWMIFHVVFAPIYQASKKLRDLIEEGDE